MSLPRPFAVIGSEDQWRRAAFENAALDGEVVQLAWQQDSPQNGAVAAPRAGAGLAFDGACRLYHSIPTEGRVERLLWSTADPLEPLAEKATPVDLFETDRSLAVGDFTPRDARKRSLKQPRGLAVDEHERLFVAETGARRILIYDLWSRRLLRRVLLGARPVALAAYKKFVYAILASPKGVVRLETHTEPRWLSLPDAVTRPSRLAVSPDGEVLILADAGGRTARVVSLSAPSQTLAIAFATDLAFQIDDSSGVSASTSAILVAARRPGEDFLRYRISPDAWTEMPPLKALHYDGLGIVCTPDNRIGFWTERGFRHAVTARLHYASRGRVFGFRLDSGEFQTNWGRIFLDACIPKDTEIRVQCVTADEPPEGAALSRTPPANFVRIEVRRPDLSPPMLPVALEPLPNQPGHRLYRRETGRELPWARRAENDLFQTYEAPVLADPGRYLWVILELSGNTRSTPRVKALRAEYPTHDYLRRLPRTYSRDPAAASFLGRYLALFEGVLGEFEGKADARHALLDPHSTPPEFLPWLASFLGLALDERWAHAPRPGGRGEDIRRTLIAAAMWLFRFRGTIPGLTQFLQIYTGTPVILVEKFRLRGLGAAVLGETARSVVGVSFRVGGSIGEAAISPLTVNAPDAFETHAHRFSVLIPASLNSEQLDVVTRILEVHRPAHTLFDVCTVDAGMRVGVRLHVALTSLIGRSGSFRSLQLGGTTLGRGAVVGRPVPGTRVGSSSLGDDSRIG